MRPKAWTRQRIKKLRSLYGESQAKFCRRLRVAKDTLAAWEIGEYKPQGPACALMDRLLEDAEKGEMRAHPDAVPMLAAC